MCACGCGQPVEVVIKKDQAFLVDKFTCQARRAIEKVRREEAEKRKNDPSGWDDGVHYYAVPHEVDPADVKSRGGARGN